MPRNKSSPKPPEPMTWPRASLVLALAIISDALRLVFEMFWFFAPILATLYCTAKVNGVLTTWTAGALGTKTAALACSAAVVGTVAGATTITGGMSAEVVEMFGVIMSMAVGILSWLAIGVILFVKNRRIFKENPGNGIKFVTSLFISEVPFLNALPSMTFNVWRMYRTQIKKEKADMKKWEAAHAAELAAERQQQNAQILQFKKQKQEEAEIQSEEEIPEEVRRAA